MRTGRGNGDIDGGFERCLAKEKGMEERENRRSRRRRKQKELKWTKGVK